MSKGTNLISEIGKYFKEIQKKIFNIHKFYALIFSALRNISLSTNTHLNC